jgi:protein-S-isoprenylcysteine O-methyltransferase Ste14
VNALDLPPLWTALFMVAAWAISVPWSPLGPEWALIGWMVIAASLALSGWAAAVMMRRGTAVMPNRIADALVTTGPFGWSRNPIYLADLGILFGWCLAVGSWAALILLWPLQRVLVKRFIEPEEAALHAKFGEAYEAYCGEVRRWA